MDKQTFLTEYLEDRKNTFSTKWDGLIEKFGRDDLLPMWIADMEFRTCDAITDALRERVEHGIYGYSTVPEVYYHIFSDWMEKRYGFKIDKKWVRFCSGCVTAIAYAINAYTIPGDSCMILTPVYYPFHNVVTNNERRLVKVPLVYKDAYFTMDYEAIERAIIENDVKLFIQCSPHNPAGRVWTEEELDSVLSICAKHNVIVVSDEIHQDIVTGKNRFVPAAIVSEGKYRDNIITINSASKTFNLASLIHSHIIITNDDLRVKYDRFASGQNRTEVSVMGMIATMAGYQHGEEWLNCLLSIIKDNYLYLKERLSSELPDVVVCPMEGSYLTMLDLRKYVDPDKTESLVQDKCRIAVDYGEWFGDGYKGFIRLNLATDPKLVEETCNRLIKCIKFKNL